MAFKRAYESKEPVKDTPKVETASDGKAALHQAAVDSVHNQHGNYVNRLKNYDELVADAERQIIANNEANLTF